MLFTCIRNLTVLLIIFSIALHPFYVLGHSSNTHSFHTDIEKLKKEIENKEDNLESLQKDSSIYEANIAKKQQEAVTLENELDIIKNKIAKAAVQIKIKEQEINKSIKIIGKVSTEIEATEKEIENNKDNLGKYLRLIQQNDKRNILNAVLVEPSFSNFFNEIEYTNNLHKDINRTLLDVKDHKKLLNEQKDFLTAKHEQLEVSKKELEKEKNKLEEDEQLQAYYLEETKSSEDKFQQLLWRTKKEEAAIRNEVANYERLIREKLKEIERLEKEKKESGDTSELKLGDSQFIWPVDPSRGITAEFHDPDYPFRHIFEHSGTDIRAYQGTPVVASESGYIARTKLNQNSTSFGYIMIIHGDGLSTLYGHMSAIYVDQDMYVRKGEVIGLSGGLPGTPGAGLSTGPHLHFEVRVNGIPVNARNYLPPI